MEDRSRTETKAFAKSAATLVVLLPGASAPFAQETAARELPSGPYFGQEPPGTVPEVFAPGVVSLDDRYEYVIAFSADGTECSFGVTDSSWSSCDLYYSREEDGVWSRPALAYFQQGGDGWLPAFSPDGTRFLFSSGPPTLEVADSWMCERTAEGWGAPVNLGAPLNSPEHDWRPVETQDGTLYFASQRPGGEGVSDIYRSVPEDGEYRSVEDLGPPVNSPYLEASPWISPDEHYLLIESWRPGGFGRGDLFISYRRNDGSWTSPQNLGPPINTEQIEDGGYVSPDGKYFFFNRRVDWVTEVQTDLYWVSTRSIFKPYVLEPIGEANAVVGEAFVLELPTDEFADHDDDTLVYSASPAGGGSLPGWLSFDPRTRTLAGTPESTDTVVIDITATDPLGSAASDALTIRIGGRRGAVDRSGRTGSTGMPLPRTWRSP